MAEKEIKMPARGMVGFTSKAAKEPPAGKELIKIIISGAKEVKEPIGKGIRTAGAAFEKTGKAIKEKVEDIKIFPDLKEWLGKTLNMDNFMNYLKSAKIKGKEAVKSLFDKKLLKDYIREYLESQEGK